MRVLELAWLSFCYKLYAFFNSYFDRWIKVMRKISALLVFLVISVLCITGQAEADVVESVTMNFQSGAEFSGSVSFATDYSSITSVSGTLTGYQYGTAGYVGTGSDTIDAVLALNTNYSSGPPIYGNFLLDGPSDGSNGFNFIQFTYDYSNAPILIFADSGAGIFGTGNYIDYQDPLVSGQIGAVGAVPELSTWFMLLIGFAGLGLYARSRKLASPAAFSAV
jgi:hypothetical protein